jgi:hypothetical protein
MIGWVALAAGGTAILVAAHRVQAVRAAKDPRRAAIPVWTYLVVASLVIKLAFTGQWWQGLAWAPLALAGPWLVESSAVRRDGTGSGMAGVGFLLGTTAAGVVAGLPFHGELGVAALAVAAAVAFPLASRIAGVLVGRTATIGEVQLCVVVGLAVGTGGPASAGVALATLLGVELLAPEFGQVPGQRPALAPLLAAWLGVLVA